MTDEMDFELPEEGDAGLEADLQDAPTPDDAEFDAPEIAEDADAADDADAESDEQARREAEEAEERARRGAVEAMLFVSDEPVTASRLSDMLDIPLGETDRILCDLATEYEEQERGVQLREVAGGWRLYSHPAYHDVIEKYVLSWDTQKLSQAALEALAVIAYNQPTTRAVVSSIRGVNSDAVISSLVEKGLVREAGRDPGVGNPILYATTRTFLEKFGLKSTKYLPPLEDFAANEETRQQIIERLSANSVSDIINDADVDDDIDLSQFDEDDDSIVFEVGEETADEMRGEKAPKQPATAGDAGQDNADGGDDGE